MSVAVGTPEEKAELVSRALSLGFVRVGVARAEPLVEEGAHLEAWLASGHHADMEWMRETAAVRADPRHPRMLPSARSVVVLVAPFARADAPPQRGAPATGDVPATPDAATGLASHIARYARGRDYHNVLRKRARKLAAWLRSRGHTARISVDAEPVFERAWAARSGVGFIGKNCLLIVPGLGSTVLLATVITSAELAPDSPMAERCGTCRACLDACPTQAFRAPRQLDARACLSYVTIESDAPVPPTVRDAMGERVFGCDACQDVCPFNRTQPPDASVTSPFASDPRWRDVSLETLLTMADDAVRTLTHASPLARPGRARLARNAAIALGHGGGRTHLPILEQTARTDASAVVRDAAAWAASRLRTRS